MYLVILTLQTKWLKHIYSCFSWGQPSAWFQRGTETQIFGNIVRYQSLSTVIPFLEKPLITRLVLTLRTFLNTLVIKGPSSYKLELSTALFPSDCKSVNCGWEDKLGELFQLHMVLVASYTHSSGPVLNIRVGFQTWELFQVSEKCYWLFIMKQLCFLNKAKIIET